jgi:nickel transport protein
MTMVSTPGSKVANVVIPWRSVWRSPLSLLFLATSLLGLSRSAWSHGVVVDYEPTEAIQVVGNYDTGEAMAEAQVVVYAPADPATPWLTGTMDENGIFLFTPDRSQVGTWEVQVRQAGHGAIITIPIEASSSEASAGTGVESASEGQGEAPSATSLQREGDAAESDTGTSAAAPAPGAIAPPRSRGALTPVQRWIVFGAMTWGFVGTALYFTGRRRQAELEARLQAQESQASLKSTPT